jgi:hypothetical protein
MLLSPKFDSAEDFMTWARSELFIGLEVPKDWMDYNFAKVSVCDFVLWAI